MSCKTKAYIRAKVWPSVVARIVVGLTFIFSSLAKGVDPYGTVLKLGEYFGALGVGWLEWAEMPLAALLIGVELLLGVALLAGGRSRRVAKGALVVNLCFLALTLWVAVADPVAECGCFGDVLTIGNWATFGKNVVLTLLSVVAVWGAREGGECKKGLWGSLLVALLGVAFVIRTFICLPVTDVFPFDEGVNIPEIMAEEMEAEAEQSWVTCRNRSTGEERRFAATDPEWWNEELWEFVTLEQPEESVKVGARDFRLFVDDLDLTEHLLSMPVCRLVCVEDVERPTAGEQAKLVRLIDACRLRGERVVLVTSSPLLRATELYPSVEVCNMDPVALRALLRAPMGVVSLNYGTIVHKATLWRLSVE